MRVVVMWTMHDLLAYDIVARLITRAIGNAHDVVQT